MALGFPQLPSCTSTTSGCTCHMCLVHLNNVIGASQQCHWCISTMSLVHLRNQQMHMSYWCISTTSRCTCVWCISTMSLVHLNNVIGASQQCHWCISTMSLVHLNDVIGASQQWHWCISTMSLVHLNNDIGASQRCHWCISTMSLVHFSNVIGASQQCHWCILAMSLVHLNHVIGADMSEHDLWIQKVVEPFHSYCLHLQSSRWASLHKTLSIAQACTVSNIAAEDTRACTILTTERTHLHLQLKCSVSTHSQHTTHPPAPTA